MFKRTKILLIVSYPNFDQKILQQINNLNNKNKKSFK